MPRLSIHAVAKAYSQSPEQVRNWRVEDYLDALMDISAENQANRDRIKNIEAEAKGKAKT